MPWWEDCSFSSWFWSGHCQNAFRSKDVSATFTQKRCNPAVQLFLIAFTSTLDTDLRQDHVSEPSLTQELCALWLKVDLLKSQVPPSSSYSSSSSSSSSSSHLASWPKEPKAKLDAMDAIGPKGRADGLIVLVILIILQEPGIALEDAVQGEASDAWVATLHSFAPYENIEIHWDPAVLRHQIHPNPMKEFKQLISMFETRVQWSHQPAHWSSLESCSVCLFRPASMHQWPLWLSQGKQLILPPRPPSSNASMALGVDHGCYAIDLPNLSSQFRKLSFGDLKKTNPKNPVISFSSEHFKIVYPLPSSAPKPMACTVSH